MSSGDLSPQVIKRGDSYVIHNIDVDQFTQVQKVALAMMIWDQVRALMEVNGEYLERDMTQLGTVGIGTTEDIDRRAAALVKTSWSSINAVRPRLLGRDDVIAKMMTGELTVMHDVQRELGMKLRVKLEEGRESQAKLSSSYYGKGDKLEEAIEPLLRYLAAWRKRDFQYPHVPPRAAQKRVAVLAEVIADLERAKADLESRSHVATLRAPR